MIVLAGLIGNTLSFIVMKSKTLRNKSYSHYLSALAVFDTLTLVIRQVRIVDEYYFNKKGVNEVFKNFDDFGCKIFHYVEHVAYLMSSWLIVLMAVERLIAVCLPFKKVVIRKKTGATLCISILFIMVCLSQAFRLVMIEQIESSKTEVQNCEASDIYLELYTSLHVYFYQWTLTFVLPVVLVLGCNILVLYQIAKIKREVRKKDKRNLQNRTARKNNRTTCMLLIVSFTFIGTLLPLFTLTLIMDIAVRKMGRDAWSLYHSLWPFIEACEAISLVNYAANFFIYILSGKRFRFELRRVFYHQRNSKRSFTARSTREEVIRL
ncbi:growth hormone secretagogue receptor type 1-like [Mercenaria mercenaria]|uniref:growth hormone secretagogue receptor type 1-like n=1 Tax=Mercenaria mercenaria TaxID=6596 RepID=UPI00234EBFCF|nr:growth hormone secretagogue receptor type 1-like [Mercenaria mercenaria]